MAKRAWTSYTDEFRASAVLMLEAAGYTGNGKGRKGALARVSGNVKVPVSTLRSWYIGIHNPPPTKVSTRKKLDLIEAISIELDSILDEMNIKRRDASYGQLATAFGIMTDKRQILTGGPTENINQNIKQIRVVYDDA